jgi:hypothetical protein
LWKDAGLNLEPAIDAVEAAYGGFLAKVQVFQVAVQDVWSAHKGTLREEGMTYQTFRDVETMRGLVNLVGAPSDVLSSHIDRICAAAKEQGLHDSLIAHDQFGSAVGVYVNAYIGYVIYSLATEKRDKSEFGDLQFFAYCDAGHRLVNSEGRWQQIVEQENLGNHFIHFM